MTPRRTPKKKPIFERITSWVGSPPSFVVHTALFIVSFVLPLVHLATWSTMLLVLTTVVSLEAIYLAIFIQMSVNRQARELEEISEDVDEIQEDIEEISEEEAEEAAEEQAEEERQQRQIATLDQLTRDVQQMLADLAAVKKAHTPAKHRHE